MQHVVTTQVQQEDDAPGAERPIGNTNARTRGANRFFIPTYNYSVPPNIKLSPHPLWVGA